MALYYSVFETGFGWFGILGTEEVLVRTCLPLPCPSTVSASLLKGQTAHRKPDYKIELQRRIQEYFEGKYIDLADVPVSFEGLSDFCRKALNVLKNVKYGEIITYRDLAVQAGSPKASRAVGRALAGNPLPLIIPCHRVICADGSVGGFSAEGGVLMKEKMLRLEQSVLTKGHTAPLI